MEDIEKNDKIVFRIHAIRHMFQRSITAGDVRSVLTAGQVIEEYPDDTPYPSKLLLGWCQGRPIHVVVAFSTDDQEMIVVTVYEPDPGLWESDFKRRRK